MNCSNFVVAFGLILFLGSFQVGQSARAARIDLIETIQGAKFVGRPARGEALSQRPPYRALGLRARAFVSNITVAFDPARAAFEMREAIGLAPEGAVTWDIDLPSNGVFSGAVLAGGSSQSVGMIRLTWRSRGDGSVATREIDSGRATPGARPQWRPVTTNLSFAAGRGELTLENVSRRSLWIGNPVVEGPREDTNRVNVVLVMVDTMTAEAVGHLGNPHGLTPNIDALARGGVTFKSAMTNANWTRPATIALLGGNYSSTFGINVNSWQLDRRARQRAYESRPDTLPRMALGSSREATAIGNNLFTMGYHAAGFDFGFTRIVDYRTEVRDTQDIVADVEAFCSAPRRSPFFLYVALNAPHHPYQPPVEYLRKVRDAPGVRLDPEVRRYFGEVAYTDDAVGRIARALETSGLAANTVLVVTSDHGEGLRADNAYTHVLFDRPSRFTHTVNLYDEVVRIPMVFNGAGVAKGRNVETQVRLLDIAPTIAELMTGRPSPKHAGSSLGVALKGEPITSRPAFTEGKRMSSVRFEGWKYIRREKGYDRVQPFGRDITLAIPEELFNLHDDPRETRNLVATATADLDRMRRLWSEMHTAVKGRLLGSLDSGVAPSMQPKALRGARPVVTTILLASDGKRHHLAGELRTSGRFVTWRLMSGDEGSGVWLAAENRLLVSMVAERNGAKLVVSTEPRDASVEVVAKLDGREVNASAILVGAFGLPLSPSGRARFSGIGLSDLYAGDAPHIAKGREAGVFIWRDTKPLRVTMVDDEGGTKLESGVESAMRAWGYIQSEKKTAGNSGKRQKKGDLE
ncbi:MAG: sulfatase-like hydrolase/transferase [Deltaproteobacteria bacterium]|nr:sulfatase-like hydrolase/transferase [Deltaproteobacteria bacterium]